MKSRLDALMVSQGLAATVQMAGAYILAGRVSVNGRPADKAGTSFPEGCEITVKGGGCPYVSRGGLKLEKGLDFFGIDPTGLTCADIGASTGGFTDCLLQRGAGLVYAIDVGYGQLDWTLRQNPKVVVMERTNARNLQASDLVPPLDLAVIDAAFISLKLLLPPLLPLFQKEVAILALIKPQFEAAREEVGKGGVIKDPGLQQRITEEVCRFAESIGLGNRGVTPSPILGPKGNKEFLVHFCS